MMSDGWCVQKIDTKLESSYRNNSIMNIKTKGGTKTMIK